MNNLYVGDEIGGFERADNYLYMHVKFESIVAQRGETRNIGHKEERSRNGRHRIVKWARSRNGLKGLNLRNIHRSSAKRYDGPTTDESNLILETRDKSIQYIA